MTDNVIGWDKYYIHLVVRVDMSNTEFNCTTQLFIGFFNSETAAEVWLNSLSSAIHTRFTLHDFPIGSPVTGESMGSYKDSMEEYKEEFGVNMGTLGLPIHAHIPTIVSHKIHDLARSKLKDTAQSIFIDPTSKEIAAHAAFLGEYVADAFRRDLHSQHLA